MINRHATAGLATALLLQHDGTFEILPKPCRVSVPQESIEAIDDYLLMRQKPNNPADAGQDFSNLNTLISRGEQKGRGRTYTLQTNDAVCRKNTETIYYMKIWFDDFQQCKNYRPGQRSRQVRDFLRTYAGLAAHCGELFGAHQVQPMLCVFANKRHEMNVYIPPANVLYGECFFNRFLPRLDYEPVERILSLWGGKPEYTTVYGDLYQKISQNALRKQIDT